MLEDKIREALILPKGEPPLMADRRIAEAIEFVENTMRKATEKSKVLVALDYLSQYGYASRYTPSRMNRR